MKQKDIPRELLINGNVWKIKFVRKIKEHGNAKTTVTVGLCDTGTKIIYLKMGLSFKKRREILAHEILHAWEAEHGFELAHKHVYLISQAFSQLFAENF